MASSDFIDSQENSLAMPKVNVLTMFRLGLFQMGLGIMSILILGVLNRVMIQEIAIPATLVGAVLAIQLLVSPSRVWFGQMSDAKPIWGYHRTVYVWVGAAIFAVASFVAVQVLWQLDTVVSSAGGWVWTSQTMGWIGLVAFVFAVYGFAICASSTTFAALLVDVSEEDNRSKVVGVVWSMLMVGIIVGAFLSSSLLGQLTPEAAVGTLQTSVNRLFTIVPAMVFGLAIVATLGVEKKYSRYSTRSTVVNREDKITLGHAWQILTASRQTAIFFIFLVVMSLGLFMQDPILEPYAGQVFKMPLAESTRLNAFYGTGILVAYVIGGFFVVPRLGKQKTARLGCMLVALCALLLGISGFSANPALLKLALLLFGLATGILTTAAITLMLDLTAPETSGTFIGAWGLAQSIARGAAVFAGGAVLDVSRRVLPNLVLAYGLVFALEAVFLILALWFLNQVNVREFQTNAKVAIASIFESELD